MAELSISEAIKLSPIKRTRFYSHYIKNGLITVSVNNKGDKYIDSAELFRCFGEPKGKKSESAEQEQGTPELNTAAQETNAVIQLLREQLDKAETREEKHLEHIVSLTLRLEAPAPETSNKELEQRIVKLTEQLEANQYRPNPIAKWWQKLGERK